MRSVISRVVSPLLCLLLLTAPALGQRAAGASDLEARRKALADLLVEHWEYTLAHSPEFASILGDKRYNDKVSDFSQKAIEQEIEDSKRFLARFKAIDTTGFPEQEALNKTLMVRDLENSVEDSRFKNWQMPITQISGIHIQAPQLAALLSFATTKDYDDYIARLNQLPRLFDDHVVQMRKGMAEGMMPPKFLLEKAVIQTETLAGNEPEKSPFSAPLGRFPDAVPEKERARIREQLLAAVRDRVLPAYARFAKFMKDEYVPRGRTEVGMWALPNGAERYAVAARRSTTTNLTPDEIHRIGLEQVAALEAEMLVVAKKLGYADLKSFNAVVDKNPDLRPKSREQILEIYRKHTDAMYAKLPQLFGRLPKQRMVVEAVEEFREKEASGAEYQDGALDGSRPGRVLVNTGDFASRKTITMESTAYHEGVPGHHMQITIAQELPELPMFRRTGGYTAYVEGWALYSERLGKEVGFYQDPYSDYGRLQDEMLRAIRLVVDTGLHHKKWSRDDVVKFFRDHSAIDEPDIQSETDRYIVWPGQALAYKIGQLKIIELRERSKRELGERFDIREFHDQVLGAGALPLDVLEARIVSWVAAKKK
jgi:uncharacterized protein (DUF885 family)